MASWRHKIIPTQTRVKTTIPAPCCDGTVLDRAIWNSRWLMCPVCGDSYRAVFRPDALELVQERTGSVFVIRIGPLSDVPVVPVLEPVCAGA